MTGDHDEVVLSSESSAVIVSIETPQVSQIDTFVPSLVPSDLPVTFTRTGMEGHAESSATYWVHHISG